jgi:voltage-gated potassium channel
MTASDSSGNPRRQRWVLLQQINALVEIPMLVLSLAWLALIIIDLTRGLGPGLSTLNYVIWGLFALHFLLGLVIAPSGRVYLRHNWITAIALIIPAFRILRLVPALRALRFVQAARSVNLVRILTSLNRGMRATRRLLARRGIGYFAALTVLITLAGAAGMLSFEGPAALAGQGLGDEVARGAGLRGYGEALWWVAMLMTTMGSEKWPLTIEGRILCLLLALYAFAIFGYLTATIASILVGRDLERRGSPSSSSRNK